MSTRSPAGRRRIGPEGCLRSRRVRISLSVVVSLLFLSTAVAAPAQEPADPPGPPQADPQVSLAATGVEVTGVTPGGEVALLSVWREQGRGGSAVTVVEEVLVDADEDGAVALELGRVPPELSVWVVVDVASGEREVVAPESFEGQRREVRPGSFRAAVQTVELAVPRAEVLLVRPGEGEGAGSFRARLGDGGTGDLDGAVNGRIVLSALQIERPATSSTGPASEGPEPPVPSRFRGRDRVLAIDPRTLAVTEVAVPAEPGGGAP